MITDAVLELSKATGSESRGAVFTRRNVVNFILDLVGYSSEEDLYNRSLLEPSFGQGEFLLAAVERLLAARSRALATGKTVGSIKHCIQGVELHEETFESTRTAVIEMLRRGDFPPEVATEIADAWLVHGDYLLAELRVNFDYIVGNPPYVRQELIPAPLLEEYRKRFATLYDRADLYVPFMEHSLNLLKGGGQLSFICSDRWMKNKYGGPLRNLIASRFHLRAYVDMVDADAFHSEVSAYPAITVISADRPGPTRVAERPLLDEQTLRQLSAALRADGELAPFIKSLDNVAVGAEPWILTTSIQTDLVRRLENSFPTLEDAGCKVGIGVATGADKAFIAKFDELDVEPDRKLPLAMGRDLATGRMDWKGYGVINPFTDEGPLVDLEKYPKLARYLDKHRAQIEGRHVAKKSPEKWFRTIDRITPALARRAKLLIPDIRGEAQVVFEEGRLYPHHNLYFVVSETWDLRALQAVLLSDVTRLFISTYSTKMRGGYLRFQAQYLRRIRLPEWKDVAPEIRDQLAAAAINYDIAACNTATAELYSLTQQEQDALQEKL
ncbi:Eco57I restriction-modification methylase domain-containing protein [Janthinobacterium sp. NKUCC06_STL]|uniref:Eco57I restriction-modification methylase domain-containing protein n=1 Tax=Janthinobacterium sp. NKUCC06_STL TaxID=2842127 RepID=UPI00214CF63D|nr:Eco57I restriction-modification methylase domain-containing protein [Janthinobacterium sp. NKUCC06_STL]